MGKKFGKTLFVQLLAVAMVTVFASAMAQGPIDFLRNIGKSVEADPQKEYKLTEMEGPYLIFAVAFSGPTARQDANALVLELRKTKKWNAFVYEKNFVADLNKDFNQAKNPYTGRTARYKNSSNETEFAVLIGNFSSLEDKQMEKTLAEVRKFSVESLKGKGITNPFSMAFAFSLANPMLPPENQRGVVDPYIASINEKRQYSLLKNPHRYTVQIATFTGQTIWEGSASALDKLSSANSSKMTELEKGEKAAIKLCKVLRERGVEAYEFHDRYSSIVTVGGFDQPLRQMPNGTTVPDQQVQQIIEQYQARVDRGSPKIVVIDGIECDPRPVIVEVPRFLRR